MSLVARNEQRANSWAALNDFYSASKHRCDGSTATGKEVIGLARKRVFRHKYCQKVLRCLFLIDVLSPVLDQMITHLQHGRPSTLLWGCVSYLLQVAKDSQIDNIATMFADICDIIDDDRLPYTVLQHSSRFLVSQRVLVIIPGLLTSILNCCTKAMENIGKKRESIRFMIPSSMTKPFERSYVHALAELRSGRDILVTVVQSEARRTEAHTPRSISTTTYTRVAARPNSYQQQMQKLIRSLPDSLNVERDLAMDALTTNIHSPFGVRARYNEALPHSSPEYKAALQRSSEARHIAKSVWIQKQEPYIQWTQSRGTTRCLWIHGEPSTGKTPLAARIIQNVKVQIDDRAPRDGKRFALGCIFISPSDSSPGGQEITNLLKDIAMQFNISLGENLKKHELHRACVDCFRRLERVYIIADGLDHACDPTKVTEALLAIFNDAYPLMKLLVLSKKTTDIQKVLSGAKEIHLL